jgi:stage II sporulation protein E
MKKVKFKKSQILLYLAIFVMFIVLANARGYSVSPFGAGALFALMWTGVYLPLLAGEYLCANLIFMNSVKDIWCAVTTVFILLLVYLIHKRVNKPMNVWLVGLYTLLSQAVSLYYVYSIGGWFDVVIFAVVCLLFLYACINVFQVIVMRGWFYKLTLDETICLLTLILVLSFGIAEVYVFNCALYKLVGVLAILFCVGLGKQTFSIVVAVIIGLGVGVVTSSLNPVGELAVIAVSANIFNMPHKYKIASTTLIGDTIVQIYFYGLNESIIYSIIPTAFAIVVFLSISSNIIAKISNQYMCNNAELSVRNVINSTRKNIKHRMSELSEVFEQMKQIHNELVCKNLTRQQAVEKLSADLERGLCKDCKNRENCHNKYELANVGVKSLIDVALKKDKITVMDLPSEIMSKCDIANLFVGKVNQLVANFKLQEQMVNDTNNVKVLLAEQMGAVSQMLTDLGDEMNQNIEFDDVLHNKILNGLLADNIVCSEVLIFTEKNADFNVVVIVKGENAYNPNIEKIISKSVNLPMQIIEVEPTDLNDFYSVHLARACKRDVVFGISNVAKTGSSSSGDSHTLIKLGNNKYLLALCDGMGSGEKARKMSALTMGLVENFYKAGFDNRFILENVNKLLSINNQESFSTLDLCVLDLNKDTVDFIKLGATYGAIKREQEVEMVESGTLPLGVLGQIKPSISHYAVDCKDMIIMVTDGITDAYENYEDFATFVNSIKSINPQVVAQTILDEAILRNGSIAKDDMTVLVARTFIKNNK